jgi:hypothetical protein
MSNNQDNVAKERLRITNRLTTPLKIVIEPMAGSVQIDAGVVVELEALPDDKFCLDIHFHESYVIVWGWIHTIYEIQTDGTRKEIW